MPSEHSSRILINVADGGVQRDATSWRPYLKSWKRCIDEFGLSPEQAMDVPVLQHAQWREAREKLGERTLIYAMEELEAVMQIASNAGYGAALADSDGILLGEVAAIPEFRCDNERMGSVWLEKFGGTNGVGTSLIENRPVAVFRDDHFFEEFAHQACVAAPFRDAHGNVLGVINLTTRNPRILEETHRVIYHVTQQSAARLEKRFFYEDFCNEYVFSIRSGDGRALHLAINELGYIVGANHSAQLHFGLDPRVTPLSFWDVFERDNNTGIAAASAGRVQLRLLRDGTLLTAKVQHPDRPITSFIQSKAMKAVDEATPSYVAHVDLDSIAGRDNRVAKQVKLVRKLADKGLPYLLLGETGVGKDTLAKAIHANSERRDKPYVAFNCAAVPESLIDSELFGYGKGAFTGANREGNKGRLLEANGGTLFLDEIGDMPLALQTRLLRVLESGEISPLGAGKAIRVDLQIIAATNRDVHEKIERGEFRSDLFYRLAGLVIELPALRERADLEHLIESVLRKYTDKVVLSEQARQALLSHSWPGNIRELRNILHRAVHIAEAGVIRTEDLLLPTGRKMQTALPAPVSTIEDRGGCALTDAEKFALIDVLARYDANVELAATALGLNKATLYRKIKKHSIDLKTVIRTHT
ncbi:sigma-54-dependent Fis family transcriptional regulator [Pseudomonas sp. BP01]|uniref:sigma-54-dependent Fis family transcriptional regulator n=1 Tax=Pseudomonas sp. BP01 TaxID=2976152 RepID=UPI001FAAD393|nr:sigma-54-dependent Fis family transcriptional regulator [Pseudomonas sp. BP01]